MEPEIHKDEYFVLQVKCVHNPQISTKMLLAHAQKVWGLELQEKPSIGKAKFQAKRFSFLWVKCSLLVTDLNQTYIENCTCVESLGCVAFQENPSVKADKPKHTFFYKYSGLHYYSDAQDTYTVCSTCFAKSIYIYMLWAGRSRDRIPVGGWDIPHPSRPALGPTQPPIQQVSGSLSCG